MRGSIHLTAVYKLKDFPSEAHMRAEAFNQLVKWMEEYDATAWGYIDMPVKITNDNGESIEYIGIDIWVQSKYDTNNTRD